MDYDIVDETDGESRTQDIRAGNACLCVNIPCRTLKTRKLRSRFRYTYVIIRDVLTVNLTFVPKWLIRELPHDQASVMPLTLVEESVEGHADEAG